MRELSNKRWTAKQWVFGLLIHIWLIIVVAIVVIPAMLIVSTSFSPTASLSDMGIWPNNPTLQNYIDLFQSTNYSLWYRNTLTIATLTMIFSSLMTMFTAFIFARFNFKGRKPMLMFIMLFQMFPSFLGLIAVYLICLNFGLLDSIYTLVIIYTAGSIPGNIFLARGYLLNIPKSLDEAAYIDGASKFQVFRYVILPLSVPILSFLGLVAFMGPWFDFILPRMLLSSNENLTLAVELYVWTDPTGQNFNVPRFSAGALLVAVPIAALQIIFQKFLVTGITAGANKGE